MRDGRAAGLVVKICQLLEAGAGEELVGFFVPEESFGFGVPAELAAHFAADVDQVADGGRAVADLDVSVGALAGADALQKILDVVAVFAWAFRRGFLGAFEQVFGLGDVGAAQDLDLALVADEDRAKLGKEGLENSTGPSRGWLEDGNYDGGICP